MPATRPAPFEVPNLDELSSDPAEYERTAEAFEAAKDVMDQLSRYCRLKADAIWLRQHGAVDAALSEERTMEAIYKALPESYRW